MAGPRKKKSPATTSRASRKAHGRFRIELVFAGAPSNAKQQSKVVSVTLEGVILQQEAAVVQKCFDAVLSAPLAGKLILDLSSVPVISQRGIDVLLRLRNKLKKQGRELEIHGLQPTVRLTLEELGLSKVFMSK
ncbi:STAS domain-containing protein [candidate division KSB1 bacterium]|nr:STAS domain-containing protein [candidate division KSB1 bacterium]